MTRPKVAYWLPVPSNMGLSVTLKKKPLVAEFSSDVRA